MTTDAEVTTVRLPHTGLQVPDRSLSVTALKQMETSDGVAYTANLRVNNRKVGLIENGGRGGPTTFFAHDWRQFGETHLDSYAGRCRSEEGQPVTVENLLDELIDEYDWARQVAAAQRKGRMLLRLMNHILVEDDDDPYGGFPPYPHDATTSTIPRNDKHWAELAKQITAHMPPGEHGWWQAWTGEGWRDVTARPKTVSAELYH